MPVLLADYMLPVIANLVNVVASVFFNLCIDQLQNFPLPSMLLWSYANLLCLVNLAPKSLAKQTSNSTGIKSESIYMACKLAIYIEAFQISLNEVCYWHVVLRSRLFCEFSQSKRFPYTDFTMLSSWSH